MQVDVVRELIDRILAAASREGSFTESMATEIERQFRQDYNGAECYIAQRTSVTIENKQEKAVAAYLEGRPVEQITSENGISRATLYRYLKR